MKIIYVIKEMNNHRITDLNYCATEAAAAKELDRLVAVYKEYMSLNYVSDGHLRFGVIGQARAICAVQYSLLE